MTATPSTRTGTTSLTRSSLQTSAPSLTRTTSSCSTKSGTRTQPFLPLPSSRPQPSRRPRVRQRPLFRRRVAASSFHRTTKLTAQPTTSRSSASSSRGTSAPPSSSACRPSRHQERGEPHVGQRPRIHHQHFRLGGRNSGSNHSGSNHSESGRWKLCLGGEPLVRVIRGRDVGQEAREGQG